MMVVTSDENLLCLQSVPAWDLIAQTNIPVPSLGKSTVPTGFFLHSMPDNLKAWVMPYMLAESGLWIQCGIIEPSPDMIVVHVFNMTSKSMKIRRGTKLARLMSVPEV